MKFFTLIALCCAMMVPSFAEARSAGGGSAYKVSPGIIDSIFSSDDEMPKSKKHGKSKGKSSKGSKSSGKSSHSHSSSHSRK